MNYYYIIHYFHLKILVVGLTIVINKKKDEILLHKMVLKPNFGKNKTYDLTTSQVKIYSYMIYA